MNITVNSKKKHVPITALRYEDVVMLAFGRDAADQPKVGEKVVYTVVWNKGEYSGSLTPGQIVGVEEGMTFNVSNTCRA